MLKIIIIVCGVLYILSIFIVRGITTQHYKDKLDYVNMLFILVPVVNTFMIILWSSGIIYRYIKKKVIIFYHWFINDRSFDKSKIK